MRACTMWLMLAGVTAAQESAEAQGPLAQLKLEAPPTQTFFCSVGEQVRLSLVGMDEKQARTPLDSYKVRVRSSNPAVVSAEARGPGWTAVDAACKADGDAWILVDANRARAWMRVLVGSARLAPAVAGGPPESMWGEKLAIATPAPAAAPTRAIALRPPVLRVGSSITLSVTSTALEHGATQKIDATTGTGQLAQGVSWQSSNPAVASVDSGGTVTGVEVGGPVTITATSGAVSATATVTVSAIPPDPSGGGIYAVPVYIPTLSPGATNMVRGYFASTSDTDRWYKLNVVWHQPSGCTAGTSIGPAFSVSLTGIPVGRQYDLFLKKDHTAVVQEARQPGNQDRSVSVGGTCGTSSVSYYVQVHRTAGLPSRTAFTLSLTQGT